MVAKVYGVCTLLKGVEVKCVGANKIPTCRPFVVFDRSYKNKSDEWQEERCTIALELWGSPAEQFAESVNVGEQVFVDGSLMQNSWEDANHNQRTTYVVRVDSFRPVARVKSDYNDRESNSKTNYTAKNNRPNQRRSNNPVPASAKRSTNQRVLQDDGPEYDDASIPF